MRADPKLQAQAFRGLGFLAVVLGLFLFAASGTVRYPEAWIFLGVFTGASLAITLVSSLHYIWHAARIIDEPRGTTVV